MFRPGVNSAAQRLRLVESLLAQPIRDAHGAHSVMADDDDVLVWIEFLMSAGGHVSHGYEL